MCSSVALLLTVRRSVTHLQDVEHRRAVAKEKDLVLVPEALEQHLLGPNREKGAGGGCREARVEPTESMVTATTATAAAKQQQRQR